MDFLSTEAQILLRPNSQLQGFGEEGEAVAGSSWEQSLPEPKRSRKQSRIPGSTTFSLNKSATAIRRRSQFNSTRRQEVAQVRHVGACLRCRSMKIAVKSISFSMLTQLLICMYSAQR